MPGSVRSAGGRSTGSSAYRRVGAQATVDETLFGNGRRAGGHHEDKEIAIVGKDTVQVRKRIHPGGGNKPSGGDAAVIQASDFMRIAESAKAQSEDPEEMRRRREEALAEQRAKSKARKDKMMRMEEERKKKAVLTDFEKDERAQKNSVLEKAKKALDEEMDDVKHMNQMMLYSKVVTIRDAQIQEKRYIQQEKEEEEGQLDMMMEIERLKALKMYEEREKKRIEDQRRGAQVIIEQIKDRQASRMKDEEQRDQERAFILRQIEALKEEEVQQQAAKKVAASRLMEEVNLANQAAMKIKEERMLAEKLEDHKILEYQQNREVRERQLEDEKLAAAAAKERETAELRAMQEKAQDKAAEMDALRAKRAMEAAERTAREKERQEKKRQDAINAELLQARKQQQAEKERRLAEQAKFERDEFERIIEVHMQQEHAERKRGEEELTMRKQHSVEIRNQIAAREERSLQDRRDFLEEGNVVRAQIAAERKKLEKIKQQKIEQLKKEGVPEKYWAELERKKISI
mmetsp:Transcript_17781/g.39237  ORF Transcript_17781/g.39237 Transcript_17781/m.39237 type:complete len:518 (+) Transcript_17781:69-1622(+)